MEMDGNGAALLHSPLTVWVRASVFQIAWFSTSMSTLHRFFMNSSCLSLCRLSPRPPRPLDAGITFNIFNGRIPYHPH